MKIYLITYKEDGTIEGYVREREDFNKWLSEHNRVRLGSEEGVEHTNEFEIKEIEELSF